MKRVVRSREHKASPSEEVMLEERVCLKDMGPPKGMGLVARRDLEKGEFVGVLAGRVLPDKTHDKLVNSGVITGRYAMETRDKELKTYVIEPEVAYRFHAARRFRKSMGHFINEPAPGERLNVAWSHNPKYDPERIDCYIAKPIKAGKELLVHYGNIYDRKYKKPFQKPLAEYVPRS